MAVPFCDDFDGSDIDTDVWLPHPAQGLWCAADHGPPPRVSGIQSGEICIFEVFGVAEPHVYAADWRPGRVDFMIDGRYVKTVHQAPDYPMQMMVAVFEFPAKGPSDHVPELAVDSVRGS